MLVLTLLIEFAHNHTGQGRGQAHGSFSLMAVSCLLKCTCHIVGNGQNATILLQDIMQQGKRGRKKGVQGKKE